MAWLHILFVPIGTLMCYVIQNGLDEYLDSVEYVREVAEDEYDEWDERY